MVGVTTMEVPLEPPGDHVKPKAVGAVTVSVDALPGQTIAGFGVIVILGPGSTLAVINAELVQVPDAPITV